MPRRCKSYLWVRCDLKCLAGPDSVLWQRGKSWAELVDSLGQLVGRSPPSLWIPSELHSAVIANFVIFISRLSPGNFMPAKHPATNDEPCNAVFSLLSELHHTAAFYVFSAKFYKPKYIHLGKSNNFNMFKCYHYIPKMRFDILWIRWWFKSRLWREYKVKL